MWLKDDVVFPLTTSANYHTYQHIVDRENATYSNVLRALEGGDLQGVISCVVENDRGRSRSSITVKSKEVLFDL